LRVIHLLQFAHLKTNFYLSSLATASINVLYDVQTPVRVFFTFDSLPVQHQL